MFVHRQTHTHTACNTTLNGVNLFSNQTIQQITIFLHLLFPELSTVPLVGDAVPLQPPHSFYLTDATVSEWSYWFWRIIVTIQVKETSESRYNLLFVFFFCLFFWLQIITFYNNLSVCLLFVVLFHVMMRRIGRIIPKSSHHQTYLMSSILLLIT